MTNKRKRTTFTKKRVNPLQKQMTRISRPLVAFDGSNVSVTTYLATPATVANVARTIISIDCLNTSAFAPATAYVGAANPLALGVLNLYAEYRYNSCSVEYIPSVGPASVDAGSRIHIAYIDNPEKMNSFASGAIGTAIAGVRGCRNVRTFNGWERFTYNVPLTWRRKVFDTNITYTVTPPPSDEYERGTQGMVIIAIESVSAATTLGSFKVNSSIRLNQLNLNLTT